MEQRKYISVIANARGPLTRSTAIPPSPVGVAQAAMVSAFFASGVITVTLGSIHKKCSFEDLNHYPIIILLIGQKSSLSTTSEQAPRYESPDFIGALKQASGY